MRGEERRQGTMLMVLNAEQRIAKDHPLRRIKQLADAVLRERSPVFAEMYSAVGRPSIPPERLLKASLLMALYTVRSERMFCEQLDHNLLFRWFLDLEIDEPSFDLAVERPNKKRAFFSLCPGQSAPCQRLGRRLGFSINSKFCLRWDFRQGQAEQLDAWFRERL